jgi:translation elongation factor EF-Tu-like GTPase
MESVNNYLEKPMERKSSRLLQDIERGVAYTFLKDYKPFFTLFLQHFESDLGRFAVGGWIIRPDDNINVTVSFSRMITLNPKENIIVLHR